MKKNKLIKFLENISNKPSIIKEKLGRGGMIIVDAPEVSASKFGGIPSFEGNRSISSEKDIEDLIKFKYNNPHPPEYNSPKSKKPTIIVDSCPQGYESEESN
jgi:hypothetical protein